MVFLLLACFVLYSVTGIFSQVAIALDTTSACTAEPSREQGKNQVDELGTFVESLRLASYVLSNPDWLFDSDLFRHISLKELFK